MKLELQSNKSAAKEVKELRYANERLTSSLSQSNDKCSQLLAQVKDREAKIEGL